jgi:RNA polymerase sigma factor for flagellar operon FliA
VSAESLFLAQLPVIETVVAQISRRHHLASSEAKEFGSDVMLHLVERDYEVLRRFEGRSSLYTYLTVVIHRLFLDYRTRLWGKWRPSAEAKRLGAVAITLERLIARDGWSFEQAVEVLRTNHAVDQSHDQLYALHVKLLPYVANRHFTSENAAVNVPSPTAAPDENLILAERDFASNRVRLALERARQTLDPEERLILKMRFDDAAQVSEIAVALNLNQKRLYRRIERILERLRACLTRDGISAEDASMVFGELGASRG